MKLTSFGTLSRSVAFNLLLLLGFMTRAVEAHEVRPAIADVTLTPDRLEMAIQLSAEAMLAGIDLSGIVDTNEAPEAPTYDALRKLSADALEAKWTEAWPELRKGFTLVASAPLKLELVSVIAQPVGDLELPRDTGVVVRAELPVDGSPVQVGWVSEYGPLVVRQGDGKTGYSGYLSGGELSTPLPRQGVAHEDALAGFYRYVVLGFEHIVPKGLDHILFVLGLFFFSMQLRPILLQITAFTLAHTVTLAAASAGIISVPANIVEPLIAASIVYIAVENIFQPNLTWSRTLIIFGFGLLHGLGFASVLGQIGVDPNRFFIDLIGFNLGVEIGQITVIMAAFMAVGLWFGHLSWYRSRIAVPASAVIALIGAFWVVERTVL